MCVCVLYLKKQVNANIKPNPTASGCYFCAILAIKKGIDIHLWFGVGVFLAEISGFFFFILFSI